MRALLDTSVLIDPPPPADIPEEAAISVLSVAELQLGVLVADEAVERGRRLDRLAGVLDVFDPIPVEEGVAWEYARLVAAEREAGRNPRVVDTMIAATARSHELLLLTRDAEQARIEGVDVQLL